MGSELVEENLIRRLVTSIKCGVCGQHYEVSSIDVLSYHEGLWFLRAICLACRTQCLMMAVVKEGKAPEVITDLTEVELDRFKNMGIITSDDVLDMHSLLKDFNGDFLQLFSQR